MARPITFIDETDPLGPPADSSTDTPLSAANLNLMQDGLVEKALVDAKGDVLAGTAADTIARVAVGANGTYLRANSAATPGVDWQTPFLTGTHAARLAASHVAGTLWKETDTGVIYLDDGTNWTIWKGDGVVRKTADETVNNSSTLQNDDHLKFPIEASEAWFVEAVLLTTGASINADFKFGWTAPASATASWNVVGVANTSNFNFVAVGTTTANNGMLAIGGTSNIGSLAGTAPVIIAGWFVAAATAGTIQLQWAQAAATAEDNKVLANSFLRIRRLV